MRMKMMVLAGALAACAGKAAPQAPATSGGYGMCKGQGAPVTDAARAGAVEAQLAPAFFDDMAACAPADRAPPAALAVADAGQVNDKGDCAWASGVSCHYHHGIEFAAKGEDRPARRELHCIFPSDDPKSPDVFGGAFTCAAGTALPHEPAHDVEAGAACGAGLLPALAAALTTTAEPRCCDDGTLTGTLAERTERGALDLRPDFHIGTAPIEIDCGALAAMHGHLANAPVYGAPVDDSARIP